MAVCRQNLPLGALSSRSAPCMLVGELFKKFCPFFEQRCITVTTHVQYTGYFLKLFSYLEKILLELNHLSVRKIKQTVESSKKKWEL
jgi:hypothetical protein